MHRTVIQIAVVLGFALALAGPLTSRARAHPARCPEAAAAIVINVNTASTNELERLPRIGPSKARAIVRMRERLGGFKRPSQLLRVKGIGRATLRGLLPHIRLVDPPEETDESAPGADPVP